VFFLLAAAALSAGQLSATSYTFTTINAPAGSSITATGINDAGEIVGYVQPNNPTQFSQQAFLYKNGTFQYIDAVYSVAMGINNLGQVIGSDENGAFLYDGTHLTTLPQSIQQPLSINNNSQIIAYSSNIGSLGVINLNTGTVEQIPNPWFPSVTSNPSALNDSGDVVGVMPAIPDKAFLYQDGTYTALTPWNDPNSWADPTGINNNGQIGGTFLNTDNPPPQLSGREEGFIYTNGTYEYVAVPGADATTISGINDKGQIIGTYDVNYVWNTFVATPTTDPTPEPATMGLLGGGLVAIALLRRKRTSNIDGPIHE
jgi:probable HAF family extracellular repeat protein